MRELNKYKKKKFLKVKSQVEVLAFGLKNETFKMQLYFDSYKSSKD